MRLSIGFGSILVALTAVTPAISAPVPEGGHDATIMKRDLVGDLSWNRDRIRDYKNGVLGSIDARIRDGRVWGDRAVSLRQWRDGWDNNMNNLLNSLQATINQVGGIP
ncbi:hypothetical protein HJFPF1_05995 [Paramyrothecium foliicola]|nr:hypothetical protein HJFPF1_05995 [Paramyrothecium foliicola]